MENKKKNNKNNSHNQKPHKNHKHNDFEKFQNTAEDSVEQLKSKIKSLEEELEINKKEMVDFQSELNQKFLNLINKKSQEASEILKTKQEEIEKKYQTEFEAKKQFLYESQFSEMVEIIAHMENVLSLPVDNPEVKNYLAGFKMFLLKFQNLLQELNIEEVNPKLMDEFNSSVMSAVKTEEAEKNKKNKILEVYSKGYKLNGRIIKLSEVKVGI